MNNKNQVILAVVITAIIVGGLFYFIYRQPAEIQTIEPQAIEEEIPVDDIPPIEQPDRCAQNCYEKCMRENTSVDANLTEGVINFASKFFPSLAVVKVASGNCSE